VAVLPSELTKKMTEGLVVREEGGVVLAWKEKDNQFYVFNFFFNLILFLRKNETKIIVAT